MRRVVVLIAVAGELLVTSSVQAMNLVSASADVAPVVEYKSAKIRWRYKLKNGVMYKRLYNYTAKKWLGSWVKAD